MDFPDNHPDITERDQIVPIQETAARQADGVAGGLNDAAAAEEPLKSLGVDEQGAPDTHCPEPPDPEAQLPTGSIASFGRAVAGRDTVLSLGMTGADTTRDQGPTADRVESGGLRIGDDTPVDHNVPDRTSRVSLSDLASAMPKTRSAGDQDPEVGEDIDYDAYLPKVIIFPQIGEVRLQDVMHPDGRLEDSVIQTSPDRVFTPISEDLVAMYRAVGPGEHKASDVREQIGVNPQRMGAALRRLQEILPETLFGVTHRGQEIYIRLGEMAITTGELTEAELTAYEERLQRAAEIRQRLKERKVYQEDRDKVNLTAYDHARISFDSKNYELDFDDRGRIIAARVLEALADERFNGAKVHLHEITKYIWGRMPTSERRLFCGTKEERIFGEVGALLHEYTNDILEGLTGRVIGITRRGAVGEYQVSEKPLRITFSQEPEVEPNLSVIRIAPYGAHEKYATASDEDIRSANSIVALLANVEQRKLPHDQAVGLIDHIMDRDMKAALGIVLRETGSQLTTSDAIETLHHLARRSLGHYRYQVHVANCMVGGHVWRRGVEQVGGRLPAGKTFQQLGMGQTGLRRWITIQQP